LPTPMVVKKESKVQSPMSKVPDSTLDFGLWTLDYVLEYDRPKSIGRVRSFFGNVGILVRGYCYIRTLGARGLREVSDNAVLNANYLLARICHVYEVPKGTRCMHEFVASAQPLLRKRKIRAM